MADSRRVNGVPQGLRRERYGDFQDKALEADDTYDFGGRLSLMRTASAVSPLPEQYSGTFRVPAAQLKGWRNIGSGLTSLALVHDLHLLAKILE